jgi:hypothetical protein
VLRCVDGAFRFEPGKLKSLDGEALSLTAYVEVAQMPERSFATSSFAADIDVESLIAGNIFEFAQLSRPANIHVLPKAPLENPLDELLSDLEETAPGELFLSQVGVISHDPRVWRGSLESGWRRRGWRLQHLRASGDVPLDELDVLVLHQGHQFDSVDQEERWTALVRRAGEHVRPVPVIWAGRPVDPNWIYRLIDAGVAHVVPAPRAFSYDANRRFFEALAQVIDRQLGRQQMGQEPSFPSAVRDLVDTLLHGADPDQAIGSLLQLAADDFLRGALLIVEETAIRCRAGFGYPINRTVTALPRGVSLLERAIRGGEAVVGIDPRSEGAKRLAYVLGIDQLPNQTAVIPLGAGTSVGGFLVVDREGQPLPKLGDLAILACCFGGAAVR